MKDTPPSLVIADIGEIVEEVNPLTFSLIDRLFSFDGPYRKGLRNFAAVDFSSRSNYLYVIGDTVYSDIERETEVYWKHLGKKLVKKNDQTGLINAFNIKEICFQLSNIILKYYWHTTYLLHPNKTLDKALEHYKTYSKLTEKTATTKSIELSLFLKSYESVVFVSYLYQLFASVSNQKRTSAAKNYQNKHNYLLRKEIITKEQITKGNLFLGAYKDVYEEELEKQPKLIPGSIPVYTDLKTSAVDAAEETLRVLKDSMRLKTGLILYYLDRELFYRARKYNLSDYGFATLNEILTLDKKTLRFVEEKIRKRKAKFLKEISQKVSDSPKKNSKKTYKGIGVSGGEIEGRLQFITSVKDRVNNDIVFLPNSSPQYTTQMLQAKGLIFNTGSRLSHGAIVARERSIPAIVCNSLPTILEGEKVKINGQTGFIKII